MTNKILNIPLSVHPDARKQYVKNYEAATQKSGRLFLFAVDQKIEHLNQDFYGPGISPQAATPEHVFKIASKSRIGAFAAHLGLIAQYGQEYKEIRYLVKLNAKTNLIPTSQSDPISLALHDIDQVVEFKKNSGLDIVGVGYTIYLGSEHEVAMLTEAAQIVLNAHLNVLLVVLWIYPRGKAVKAERSAEIIAGAAGVAASLGADFVKVMAPQATTFTESAQLLKQASMSAGKTKVVCAGGSMKDEKQFLKEVYDLIHVGGASGAAVGRNIFQRDLDAAIGLCDKLASIIIDNGSV
jgi:fructose-bisphosphate aldolase/6-deoxy-5-ketofructose 1-phosphate synthase